MRSFAALLVLVTLSACATTWTAQTYHADPDIEGAEIVIQKTVVMAIGKAGIESATPHATSEDIPGDGHLITTGSETLGLRSEEAIIVDILEMIRAYMQSLVPPAALPIPDPLR